MVRESLEVVNSTFRLGDSKDNQCSRVKHALTFNGATENEIHLAE